MSALQVTMRTSGKKQASTPLRQAGKRVFTHVIALFLVSKRLCKQDFVQLEAKPAKSKWPPRCKGTYIARGAEGQHQGSATDVSHHPQKKTRASCRMRPTRNFVGGSLSLSSRSLSIRAILHQHSNGPATGQADLDSDRQLRPLAAGKLPLDGIVDEALMSHELAVRLQPCMARRRTTRGSPATARRRRKRH